MSFWSANALALITAGYKSRRLLVRVKKSKLTLRILSLLYHNGLIRGFSVSTENPYTLIVFLKYVDSKPMIKNFQIISSGSRRVYCNSSRLLTKLVNDGVFVVSTSRIGIVTSTTLYSLRNTFRCGGEVLFRINFY